MPSPAVGHAGPRGTLQSYQRGIEDALLRHFGATGLADVILCPSGTDALLTAAAILAVERPGQTMTAILPIASETGTGVPLAAAGRWFDGPAAGRRTGLHDQLDPGSASDR